MLDLFRLFLPTLATLFHERHDLILENLLLRHQLQVALRSRPRQHFKTRDRFFWLVVRGGAILSSAELQTRSQPRINKCAPQPGREELLQRWSSGFTDVARLWWDPAVVGSETLQSDDLNMLRDEAVDQASAWEGVDAAYRANFEFDLAAALAAIRAPTLIIELVTEETARLGAQAPLLKALMTDCQILTIEEHDRTLLRDHPEALATVLTAFLS